MLRGYAQCCESFFAHSGTKTVNRSGIKFSLSFSIKGLVHDAGLDYIRRRTHAYCHKTSRKCRQGMANWTVCDNPSVKEHVFEKIISSKISKLYERCTLTVWDLQENAKRMQSKAAADRSYIFSKDREHCQRPRTKYTSAGAELQAQALSTFSHSNIPILATCHGSLFPSKFCEMHPWCHCNELVCPLPLVCRPFACAP